jgi:putative membrane protein
MARDSLRGWARAHPRAVTAVVSVVGYALVIGVFAGVLSFPPLSDPTVVLFSDLIAVVNTVALTTLLLGWRFVKRGEIRRHRAAMLTTFALIMCFLVLYLWKVGGGFEKRLLVEQGMFLAAYRPVVVWGYRIMLAVHILLSVVAVPVVLHAVVLGLTHDPAELPNTSHPRVGRIAVAAWSLSLALGIVTYLLLNHVYTWEPIERGMLLLVVPAGRSAYARWTPNER